MQAQDQRCHDLLYVMDYAIENSVSLKDLNYIFERDFVADLVEFVKAHGVTHLGRITKNSIPADWPSTQYWRDPALMLKLADENKQTEQFVKFGLLAALPDWRLVEFLTRAGWEWQKVAQLVGYHIDHHNHVSHR
jgi:hypothetical protein